MIYMGNYQYKNPELHKIIEDYVTAAIFLINNNPDWRFAHQSQIEPPALGFIFSHTKLKKLPEYKVCAKALKKDKKIKSQLDILIGIQSYSHVSPTLDELMVRLPNLGVYRNNLEFNSAFFDIEYQRFEEAFYEDKIKYEVIVPVTGYLMGKSLRLNSEIEFCRVTRDDLNIIPQETGEDLRSVETVWAIRSQYAITKIVGNKETDLKKADLNDQRREEASQLIEKVISCLRIYGLTNVYPLAHIHRAESMIFRHVVPFPIRFAPKYVSNWVLTNEQVERFVEFWKQFETVVNNVPFIATAARRCSYAYERHNPEDKIIDLLIAAEALFLSQLPEKNELSYRLKLNAAFFLGGGDSKLQRLIFKSMGRAYNLRSTIVHGGSDIKKAIGKIEKAESADAGGKIRIEEFISKIESYCKTTIVKMTDLAVDCLRSGKSTNKLVDWESLILGETLSETIEDQ